MKPKPKFKPGQIVTVGILGMPHSFMGEHVEIVSVTQGNKKQEYEIRYKVKGRRGEFYTYEGDLTAT